MTKVCGAASTQELCGGHEQRVRALEASGKEVDRRGNFRVYQGLLQEEAAYL